MYADYSNTRDIKPALQALLHREPCSVDMEDILSVHGDWGFNTEFQKLGSSGADDSFGEAESYSDGLSEPTLTGDVPLMDDEFLISLKKNRRNVSGRLRYAYLNDTDGVTRSMDLMVLARLRRIMDKVEQIYSKAGGDAKRLKLVILEGRGNVHKNFVEFTDEGPPAYNYRLVRWGVGAGLAGISAADFIENISDTLKQLMGLFPHDEEAEAAFQRDTNIIDAFNILSNQFSPQHLSGSRSEQMMRTAANEDSPVHGTEQDSRQSSPDGTRGTRWKSMLEDGSYKGPIGTTMDWIADNPGKTILIAAALVSGGILIKRALERTPAAREVDGLPSTSRTRTPGISKTKKKVRFTELV